MIQNEIEARKALGFNLGIKLVRGAYMAEERDLALLHGYESPICDTIEDTHDCFDQNVKNIIENLGANCQALLGTHNISSVEKALYLIEKHQIIDHRITFAQLKGFSDQLTGKLARDENVTVLKLL